MRFLITLCVLSLLCACTPAANPEEAVDTTTTVSNADLIPYTELYDSGQIRIKGWNKDGKREGKWMSFFENGVRWSEDTYRNGLKDGPTKAYYKTGILKYSGIYLEDRKVGTWNFYDDSGKLVEAIDYNP